jgi:hypothetical protein
MSKRESLGLDPEHNEVTNLLAWYVNATLDAPGQARVEAHLKECAICREDLELERRIYRGIADDAAVEYMPAASLKRLRSRLDGVVPPAPEATPIAAGASRVLAGRRTFTWQTAMAASAAVMAVAVSFIAADHWTDRASRQARGEYRTVTEPRTKAPQEVIRAVFAPDITLTDLKKLLDESQLRIVEGPSEAGVYALASSGGTPVDVSLARLRTHDTVRFAESTQVVTDTGRTP